MQLYSTVGRPKVIKLVISLDGNFLTNDRAHDVYRSVKIALCTKRFYKVVIEIEMCFLFYVFNLSRHAF